MCQWVTIIIVGVRYFSDRGDSFLFDWTPLLNIVTFFWTNYSAMNVWRKQVIWSIISIRYFFAYLLNVCQTREKQTWRSDRIFIWLSLSAWTIYFLHSIDDRSSVNRSCINACHFTVSLISSSSTINSTQSKFDFSFFFFRGWDEFRRFFVSLSRYPPFPLP